MFRIFAACALIASAYHVLGVCGVLTHFSVDASTPMRHAIFVAIDLLCAWYLIVRPRPLLPLFLALTVQQTFSHGSRALGMWNDSGRVDIISLVTLTALYAACAALVRDAYPSMHTLEH